MKLSLFVVLFSVISGAFAINLKSVHVSDEEYYSMPPLFHVDDYDRCMVLKEKALYCALTLQLSPLESHNSTVWKIIEKIISSPKNYRHDQLRHRICVPEYCPFLSTNLTLLKNDTKLLKSRLSECYNQKYFNLGLSGVVTEIQCETNVPRYSIDEWDIFVAVLYAVIITVVIFATFYEGLARYKSQEEYDAITSTKFGTIISCFSVIKNWKRLGNKSTNVNIQPLKCMNAVRFYNIFGVVLSHTFILSFVLPVINPQFLETASEKPGYMLVLNGSVIIQTYFLMAGWLLSYNFFLLIEKHKTVKLHYVFMAFIYRYLRLTPCLALVIAFNTSWLYHIGSGPFWDKLAGEEYRNCRKNWWTNLLYINNYYDFQHVCMLPTWYLGADTQLFFLALIIMTIIWKFKQYIKTILGVSLFISFIIPAAITYVKEYDILIRYYPELLYQQALDDEEFRETYIPAHTNLGGYVIGMIFGYIYYKYKDNYFFTKKSYIVAWWIIILSLPLTIIFVAHPLYQESYEYSRIGAAIYNGVARNLFALAVAIALFGGVQKIGWFLRSAVVWPPLQILGRITYCIYLVHFPLIRIRLGLGRTANYLTLYDLIIKSFMDLFVGCVFGTILCLFVEMPTSALQKLIMPKPKAKQNDLNKQKITNIAVISNDNQMSKM